MELDKDRRQLVTMCPTVKKQKRVVDIPVSVNPIEKLPHRHSQRHMTSVILHLVELTIRFNHLIIQNHRNKRQRGVFE